jgi:hypothetical protein
LSFDEDPVSNDPHQACGAEMARLEKEIERLNQCGPDNCPNHPKNKDPWVRASAHDAMKVEVKRLKKELDHAEGQLVATYIALDKMCDDLKKRAAEEVWVKK